MAPKLRVFREAVAGGAAVDTAVSRLLLEAVARGEGDDCLRLWQPGPALAFSGIDRTRPGFAAAVAAARAAGYEPFVRLAGGHAAAYAPSLLAFVWTTRAADARRDIAPRFGDTARRLVESLAALGVDARVGAVPDEFCPGEHSVNARGRVKLVGVGQRVVRGAAHVGGVLLVQDDPGLRQVLGRVYAALELPLAAESFGSVEAECGERRLESVAEALLARFAADHRLVDAQFDAALLRRAGDEAARHRIDAPHAHLASA